MAISYRASRTLSLAFGLNRSFNIQLATLSIGTIILSFFSFFWSGLQGPNAYSLWYGVVPKPSIGEGDL